MIPGTRKKKILVPMPFGINMKTELLNQIHMDQRSYPVKFFSSFQGYRCLRQKKNDRDILEHLYCSLEFFLIR